MEFKILFDIHNLLLENNSECYAKDFIISHNQTIRESHYTAGFKAELGENETRKPKDTAFAYGVYDLTINKKTDLINELRKIVYEKMRYLESFISLLWLAKDCSVFVDSAIGQIKDSPKPIIIIKTNSAAWNIEGKMENVIFSESDFKKVDELSSKLSTIFSENLTDIEEYTKDEKPNNSVKMGHSPKFNYNEYNPMQRAFVFLSGARKINYIPYRIAWYMPIFECLFSSDASEVTQKVAERTAFYISDDKSERKEIFKAMRDGYDFRSRFLHGQEFKSKHTKPEHYYPLAKQIDNITRMVLQKIIQCDIEKFCDKNENNRTEFLNNIIFS